MSLCSRSVADRARKRTEAKRQELSGIVEENSKLYREIVPPKTPIWDATVISELYHEQNGLCALCCDLLVLGEHHVDHKIPVSRGGGNERENLQLTHPKCNQSKGAKVDTRDLHHYIKDEVEKRNL
jgi:5-methylcytosine-specific restriction endonuclease McrA